MSDASSWYDLNVAEAAQRYEALVPSEVHAWLMDLLPEAPALVLDVGAGTGRDAAWLAARGLEIVAVEPSQGMRTAGQRLHRSAAIRWVEDRLPSLEKVLRLGLSFDFILASAVWMHVPLHDRARAFRKPVTLLKPGGRLAITLHHGPDEPGRHFYAVSHGEIEALARAHGVLVERVVESRDKGGRDGVTWTHIAMRLPDDGTGALPLLRHIILNDSKASTYKLALLRVLCRIADGAAGYSMESDSEHVSVPLGLVALYWIRLFKPLLAAGLPQSRRNVGYEKLGFVKNGFRALNDVSHLDLRIGMMLGGDHAPALHDALRDAARVIEQMPAHFITYSSGGPVFPVRRAVVPRSPSTSIRLDATYLSAFGELHVPRHLWRALQRFDVWIEPALIAEWSRLMADYAGRQGRPISEAVLAATMAWSEPSRDVQTARQQALRLLGSGSLHCVWTGRALTPETLDVDHCFPWSAWPCEDLWNLLPTHREVNQRQKRERLPSIGLLRSAQDRILEWWDFGYLKATGTLLPDRFMTEARATLPLLGPTDDRPDDVFSAVALQQVRLKYDQQVPVWDPD
jgi:SAM-dependent methyltransferase